MTPFKPMLAHSKSPDPSTLTYPLIVQPKLDGIRCSIVDGKAVSRTLKPIPNNEIREYLSRPEFDGLDGELIVGSPTAEGCMQRTTSFVMAPNKTGEDWTFWVFDAFGLPEVSCIDRADSITDRMIDWDEGDLMSHPDQDTRLIQIENWTANGTADVDFFEAQYLEYGYEGVILRDPEAAYKFGRSGKKGPLLKLKRFVDFEAEIVGVYEMMHNGNEATTNALGRTERSSHKDGKVGLDTLGGFVVRAINGVHEGQEFRVGSGFTAEQRREYWTTYAPRPAVRASAIMTLDCIGKTIKVKSFPVGVKDLPRHPIFLGFRDMEVDG